ncbi:MbnP family protein [Pinibacter aurantiacus]|uniref:Copper-binding protein MbnP-like domain-containing protein n=1 Tax=Pinibacter aurantiacus TaxID=2851599 RepID=A0A9E2S9L2_9BACT|nr:MbnP family protein [Pinibacter aurantiacus]MBV4357174.1 hypothetical protein [Pinibacter aurantiacus]
MKIIISAAIATAALFFASCQPELKNGDASSGDSTQLPTYNFVLSFKGKVDNADLAFNQTYQNSFGESYTITTFKYYIGDIQLLNSTSGKVYNVSAKTFYLVDASDSASSNITLKAPVGTYDVINFTMGVDSIYNVSGAQSGDLDPVKGMFWTWNTGYIMAKMEGTSPLSHLPDNRIQFHIGGFKTGESAIRSVNLTLPEGRTLAISSQGDSKVTINADANKWFYNPHDIHIADTAVCMTPGTLATNIADNYAKMFTVVSVTN